MATGKSDMPSKLWYATNTMFYSVRGDRDVLILAPDLSLSHYEAVARRPGQLTEEDRLKLQSQGLPLDCHNELDILNARYELDNECTIVEVKSGKSLSREKAIENIGHLLNTTKNDGGKNF